MHSPIKIAAAIGLIVAIPAHAENTPVRQTLQNLSESDERVAGIGFRLMSANASRCSRLMPGTGMVLHSLLQYGGPVRADAARLWAFPSPVSIAVVVKGSPAERAGLRRGDGLVSIANRTLPSTAGPDANGRALRDEAEQALAVLPPAAPIKLTIRRDGKSEDFELQPVPVCRSRLEVVAGNSLKARSDGKIIQVGQAFIATMTDVEIAVILSHELAHTILDHREKLARLESGPQDRRTKAARMQLAREFEDQADLVGVELLAGAGWDPAAAPKFMRRHGRRFDPTFFGSNVHRSAEDRARRMERHIAGLNNSSGVRR